MFQKLLGVACVSSLLIAAPLAAAGAADIPLKAPPPLPSASAPYDWSGFYVGASVGGLWDTIDGTFIIPPIGTWSTAESSPLAGGQIGVQKQFASFVLGVEADGFAFSNTSSNAACGPAAACGGLGVNQTLSNGLWTAGGRAGWAAGSLMPYLTGGYASTKISYSDNFNNFGQIGETASTREDGYYVGGGVDYMIAPHVVAGLEYRHYQFNTATTVPTLANGTPNTFNTLILSPKADSFALRLSWLFNGR